jgi:Flp pilus assembly protein TadG
MIEFALALPIVLLLVIGMFEVGRLIVYYSAVNSAAREAARYGAASGKEDGLYRYCNQARIREAAVKAGFVAGVEANSTNVKICYDTGPTGSTCNTNVSTYDPCATGAKLLPGTRVYITVEITYRPTINFPSSNVQRTVRASAARTILSKVSVPDAAP